MYKKVVFCSTSKFRPLLHWSIMGRGSRYFSNKDYIYSLYDKLPESIMNVVHYDLIMEVLLHVTVATWSFYVF